MAFVPHDKVEPSGGDNAFHLSGSCCFTGPERLQDRRLVDCRTVDIYISL